MVSKVTIMQARQFFGNAVDRVRRDGLAGVRETGYRLYRVGWNRLSALDRSGQHVYDADWDVLIVLDACRTDLLAEVASEFEYLPATRPVRSVASTSKEWLAKTFGSDRREETRRTAYVTGNPFSASMLDATDFAVLDEVWQYGWDDDLGTVPADPLTDRAIAHWRAGAADRMIVHYMQPHFPSVPHPEVGSGIDIEAVGDHWESVWDALRRGQISETAVWTAYRDNLRYALEHVQRLVESIDADRVVITADHANSFGSWGLYGHPSAPIRAIREVPWVALRARDTGAYDPDPQAWVDAGQQRNSSERGREAPDEAVAAKLRNLGYL